MTNYTILTNIANLVTVNANGACCKVGADMRDLGVIEDGAIVMTDVIVAVGNTRTILDAYASDSSTVAIIDCAGKTVLPGFVDAHTHMVFAGSRAHEYAQRLAGVPYTKIAAEGGGILRTMRAVREASVETIEQIGRTLVSSAIRHGTTTIEIKSGYGLSTQAELKLLEAAYRIKQQTPAAIHITFLGAHDVPPEYRETTAPFTQEDYVQLVIADMLPAVVKQGYATACDVFTDAGFFTVEQSERICNAAKVLGLSLHVHADEIANIGASSMAARLGALSADHLEFTTKHDMQAMGDAGVVAMLLPGTAYTLRLPYPDARQMIEEGLVVALATDCNPGSNFSENMQGVLSLACTNMSISIEEAIIAATLHGAQALRIANHKGSIEVGKDADVVVYDVPEYANIVYHYGVNHVEQVFIAGKQVV